MSGDIIVAVMYTVVTVNNTERGNVRLRLDISMYSSTADTAAAAAAAQYRRVVIAVRVIAERRNHVTLDAVQVLHICRFAPLGYCLTTNNYGSDLGSNISLACTYKVSYMYM